MPDPRRHTRRYTVRFIIGIAAYSVLLVLALVLAPHVARMVRVFVMLLPVPGILIVAWALWRYLKDSDEMIRRDQLIALAIAFGMGSVISFTYGLLQLAGAPQLSWLWVWPVYAACWLIARLVQWFLER